MARRSAIYSFRFDGPPPTGAFYTLAFHDVEESLACGRYGVQDAPESGDFWLLEVTINQSESGVVPVSLLERDGAPIQNANVTLLHRSQGAFLEAYDALSGSVSLTATPAPEDAKAGATLDGQIEAEFPLHAVQEVSCQGGGDTTGAERHMSCTCKDSDSVVTSCTPTASASCCQDVNSERLHVTIPFAAQSCPNMCRWAAGLPIDYCNLYFGGT